MNKVTIAASQVFYAFAFMYVLLKDFIKNRLKYLNSFYKIVTISTLIRDRPRNFVTDPPLHQTYNMTCIAQCTQNILVNSDIIKEPKPTNPSDKPPK